MLFSFAVFSIWLATAWQNQCQEEKYIENLQGSNNNMYDMIINIWNDMVLWIDGECQQLTNERKCLAIASFGRTLVYVIINNNNNKNSYHLCWGVFGLALTSPVTIDYKLDGLTLANTPNGKECENTCTYPGHRDKW